MNETALPGTPSGQRAPSASPRSPDRARNLARFASLTTTALLLAYAAFLVGDMVLHQPKWDGLITLGQDYQLYMRGVDRFLATGTPYLPEQINGAPYDSFHGDVFLYPPFALLLMLPMRLLPWFAWWIVPIGVIAVVVWHLRPGWPTWPFIAACIAWPRTISYLGTGNTDMWVAAFVAATMLIGWPAAFVAIKPSFAPLMLFGARDLWWWLAVAALAAFSVLTLGLTEQYVTVVREGNVSIGYSLISLPVTLIGPIAWLGRRRTPSAEPITERSAGAGRP